jgi:NAD(P)-dependent dehydrogenase (short-subunit alcohol dehydrogenase family)
MKVNFLGTLHGAKQGAARMLADGKGGSIINIASVGGVSGQPGYPAGYAASKAAVANLTQTLAVNWADRGVRVNAIAPGWFPSEMADPFLDVEIFKANIVSRTPMGRIGKHDELVGPLLFLASDASTYVTGHILVVDGGMSASFGAPKYSDELYAFHAAAVPGLGERIMPA